MVRASDLQSAGFEFDCRPRNVGYIQGRIQDFKLGGREVSGSGGWKSPSGVQGQSPGRGSSPPEAEAFLCMKA